MNDLSSAWNENLIFSTSSFRLEFRGEGAARANMGDD